MVKLETERLLLREWTEDDLADMIEGLNNIEVAKWLAFVPNPYTEEDGKKWISYCQEQSKKEKRTFYEFAIALKETEKVIGSVSLVITDEAAGFAGGGIWLNAKYHGMGYGGEAFAKRTEFAFAELNIQKLENGFFQGNTQSEKMQKQIGYKVGGIRKNAYHCLADGKWKDECVTVMTKEDWENRKER